MAAYCTKYGEVNISPLEAERFVALTNSLATQNFEKRYRRLTEEEERDREGMKRKLDLFHADCEKVAKYKQGGKHG